MQLSMFLNHKYSNFKCYCELIFGKVVRLINETSYSTTTAAAAANNIIIIIIIIFHNLPKTKAEKPYVISCRDFINPSQYLLWAG